MSDQRFGSGGPWEDRYGYSRVVVVDDHAWVAGCTSTVDGEVVHVGDAFAQTEVAFGVALDALRGAGFDSAHVVRTRMFVSDGDDLDAVGRAHGHVFGDVRPAATALVVSGFVDARMRVEVEVEACRPRGS